MINANLASALAAQALTWRITLPNLEAIEGYYVQTTDDLFLAVKGLIHPPDRVIAYLRYVPDAQGDRERGGVRYRRVYRFADQVQLLRDKYPQYLFFDPVFGAPMQGVPREHLKAVHNPALKLMDLRSGRPLDNLERQTVAFARLLQQEANVPWDSLGVSGSLLIGLHTPASDIDLVVYGREACWAVHGALRRLLGQADRPGTTEACSERSESVVTTNLPVSRLDEQGLAALYASRVQDTHMTFGDFVRHERRKVIQGRYKDREFFIRFVEHQGEVAEQYGDVRHAPAGLARIRARVIDSRRAIFTPCHYGLTGVEVLDGPQVEDLTEVVSFRGRFCEQALEGETIVAAGKLEKVYDKSGQIHHRLLLGGQPEDHMVTEVAELAPSLHSGQALNGVEG